MKDILFTVESLNFITGTVFELSLLSGEDLPFCRAGQFVHLQTGSPSAMLRRPFCLYHFSKRSIRLIIAVVGKGTEQLSKLKKGDRIFGIVPIGNGFIPNPEKHQKIALIGGGVGCAPLLAVQTDNPNIEVRSFLGFNTDSGLLKKFKADYESVYSSVAVSTDDGSFGYAGFVTQLFLQEYEKGYRPDAIFTCGSEGLIKSVAKLCAALKIPGYMSGETRMGCGVGACLVCACAVKGAEGVFHNKRACVDGPVFALEDLQL